MIAIKPLSLLAIRRTATLLLRIFYPPLALRAIASRGKERERESEFEYDLSRRPRDSGSLSLSLMGRNNGTSRDHTGSEQMVEQPGDMRSGASFQRRVTAPPEVRRDDVPLADISTRDFFVFATAAAAVVLGGKTS